MLPVWQLADEKRKGSPVRSSLFETGWSQRRRKSVPPDAAKGCEPWVREKVWLPDCRLRSRSGSEASGVRQHGSFPLPGRSFPGALEAGIGQGIADNAGPRSTSRQGVGELRAGVATAGQSSFSQLKLSIKQAKDLKRRGWPCLPISFG